MSGIQIKERDKEFGSVIRGTEVADIVTMYSFKNGVMCFDVLLYSVKGETIPYKELNDYMGYKNTLSELQEAKQNDLVIKIPAGSVKSSSLLPKVA